MANDKCAAVFSGDGMASLGSFPKEFRRGAFSRIEPHFALILLVCFLVVFTAIGILSLKKPSEEITDREIEKIQERYASLILHQPKPKVETPVDIPEKPVEKEMVEEKAEEEKEVAKIDREKETFLEKQQRKEATSEERHQKREQISQELQSSGIFAAITAAGSSGGLGVASASDLLGTAAESVADIGDIKIGKGAFAARQVTSEELRQRRGGAADVTIEKQDLGKKEFVQVASAASVNITSEPPEVSGESSGHADRSQAAIQKIVNRETQRLKRVFEDWLKRDPSLGGNLTIKFIILPSGAVSSVSIVKSTTQNSAFDETIVRYIKRWQFPEVVGGGPVEVIYPFVFAGQS